MSEGKNKGGRPRENSSVKMAPLNMRTDPVLRERIERWRRDHKIPSTTKAVEQLVRLGLERDAA